jgi:5'-nucleotidase
MPLDPAAENTDRWAVDNGYTSITPLRLDLTNEKELIRLLNLKPVVQH